MMIMTNLLLYDECIPMKKCKTNRKKDPMSPWITKDLLKSINKKNTLYKQYLKSPTNGNLQKLKTYKNKLTVLIRKSKRMHFFTKFEKTKNNMKQTWRKLMTLLVRGEEIHHSGNLKIRVTIQLLTLMTFLTNLTTFL